MNKHCKVLISAILTGSLFFVAGCGSDSEPQKNSQSELVVDSAEVNANYEEFEKNYEADKYEKLPEGNHIDEEFTSADFSVICVQSGDSALQDNSFSVPKNGYAILTPQGAAMGYIGKEATFLGGTYTNVKDYGFESTRDQIISSYKVDDDNIYTVDATKIAFGFSSADGNRFTAMSWSDVQKAIEQRTANPNPAELMDSFTVAIVELSADESGMLTEYAIYHHCTEDESTGHNH